MRSNLEITMWQFIAMSTKLLTYSFRIIEFSDCNIVLFILYGSLYVYIGTQIKMYLTQFSINMYNLSVYETNYSSWKMTRNFIL